MSSKDEEERNPLGMEWQSPEGAYGLPPMLCSRRRREYFGRVDEILGFYATISFYSSNGQKWVENWARHENINDERPMKFDLCGRVLTSNYGTVKRMFKRAGVQLTNQVFLMVYGNFEAFLTDLLFDAFTLQSVSDPMQESINLMMGCKWPGKIDRISQELHLELGKGIRVKRFRDLRMGFLGNAYTDPIEFLQAMADLRHRLVHSTGRADVELVRQYPKSGLSEGDLIALPLGLPNDVHFFFVLLTEIIDEAFSVEFDLDRTLLTPKRPTY